MAFTDQDLKNQQQEIARLADELNRLNNIFEEQKKALGIEGEIDLSDIEMTPAMEQAMADAKAEAQKEGRARAALLKPATNPSTSTSRARRGAMRI